VAHVGFIGLGIMGTRMAANLRRAGVELTVFNRTRERAEAWAAEHGATVADSPADVGRAADVVITMVVDGPQVEAMLLGPGGVADVHHELAHHVGELGQGQTVKLINNAVAATNLSTLAQALIVGRATGVNLDALMTIMGAGSGGSAMLTLKGQPLVDHDYATLFKLEHMLKDVRLCLEEGQAAGVPFPAAAQTREVLTAGMGRGLGDADFAAMLVVLEALADTRL
jgi:3-hydroxyisobutyrate dehydrogenase-like beta-hydroxyacid dehydrogenase